MDEKRRTDITGTKAQLKSLIWLWNNYIALQVEGGGKLIDRHLSSDYDRCTVKQVEPARSCSYLTYNL